MTPEETANDIVESMGNEVTMPHLWRIKIKKAIKAAIEQEREGCAMIADEMKVELSQRPEKLHYGRTQIEVAEYIGQQIRARSS
jgi:hypothetical protein